MSEWIAVSDKLPDEFTRVLVWNGEEVKTDLFLTLMFHKDSHGLWKTTHWMKLPEPPK